MRLKTFEAPTLKQAMDLVREAIGDDAMIVATERAGDGGAIRVTAAVPLLRETPASFHVDKRAFNGIPTRSEEHTSELQSLMRISYAVFCLKKKKKYALTNQINKTKHNKTNIPSN